MSDRHKYRVWDEVKKKFVSSMVFINHHGETCLIQSGCFYPNKCVKEHCTGLTDKNGKLIYEGDVLQAPGRTKAYKVQWAHHGFVMKAGFSSAKSYPMSGCEMFEIIGNIHEQEVEK